MPYGIKVAGLPDLDRLRDWQIRKVDGLLLDCYIGMLRYEEEQLRERMEWLRWHKGRLEDEAGRRASAAAQIQAKREKAERQAKVVEERNARLEREYLSEQYAE